MTGERLGVQTSTAKAIPRPPLLISLWHGHAHCPVSCPSALFCRGVRAKPCSYIVVCGAWRSVKESLRIVLTILLQFFCVLWVRAAPLLPAPRRQEDPISCARHQDDCCQLWDLPPNKHSAAAPSGIKAFSMLPSSFSFSPRTAAQSRQAGAARSSCPRAGERHLLC